MAPFYMIVLFFVIFNLSVGIHLKKPVYDKIFWFIAIVLYWFYSTYC